MLGERVNTASERFGERALCQVEGNNEKADLYKHGSRIVCTLFFLSYLDCFQISQFVWNCHPFFIPRLWKLQMKLLPIHHYVKLFFNSAFNFM